MAFPDKNYVVGRGKLFFGLFAAGTRVLASGMDYFGNTPSLSLSNDGENLDHFDSDNGVRVKDDTVVLEQTRAGSFVTDHISPKNVSKWLLGAASVVSQAVATAVVYNVANVNRGQSYQIGETAGNPIGVRGLTSVSVQRTDGTPVALVENLDYAVNLATGLISILETSDKILAVDNGVADIAVTYSAPALQYNKMVSGSTNMIEGRLYFQANNPKGLNTDYLFPYVQLKPDGDFELKGDEWQQLSFAFEVLKRDDNTEPVYAFGRAAQGI